MNNLMLKKHNSLTLNIDHGYAKLTSLLVLVALSVVFVDRQATVEVAELNIVERCISMDGFTELSEECSEFVKFVKSEGIKV